MKILNLYCGIGGNRKLWGDEHDITSVEFNPDIAAVYQDLYPNDKVIVGDAHEYLLKHFREYAFIWASPSCQSHSRLIDSNYKRFYKKGQMKYPDMSLYQEIIILQHYAKKEARWVVENVLPYYKHLIKPSVILHRHSIWCNFNLPLCEFTDERTHMGVKANSTVYGISLNKYQIDNKRQILRNMVNPEVGKYILDRAMEKPIVFQNSLFEECKK